MASPNHASILSSPAVGFSPATSGRLPLNSPLWLRVSISFALNFSPRGLVNVTSTLSRSGVASAVKSLTTTNTLSPM